MAKYVNPVVSDGQGTIFEVPGLKMTGMALTTPIKLDENDLIPLPEGSDLFELPGRTALAENPVTGEIRDITHYQGKTVVPVAAFMAPAYIQIARAAYGNHPDAPVLPLFSYTAVGWWRNRFHVAGVRIDRDQRQDLKNFRPAQIKKAALRMANRYPRNRLVSHLVYNCVFRYGCPAARNFVLERWECPAPVSPSCNAGCIGCLSKQEPDAGIESPMDRITFIPTVEELVEFCLPHLRKAPRPVLSFGQGCEGEPLLQGDLIEETIRALRRKTDRGIININTNGSRPDVVERLCRAGLDSIRISLNSAREHYYTKYFQPHKYTFDHVVETMRIVHRYHRWISINYFIMPGFTDHPDEINALDALLDNVPVDMIQTRNLNCDPDVYQRKLQLDRQRGDAIGIKEWLALLREKYSRIKLGYFNPPREEMTKK